MIVRYTVIADGDCDFETGLCDWGIEWGRQLKWIRHRGRTKTSASYHLYPTGPVHDHTLYTDKGYYLYMDSSAAKDGFASLSLPVLQYNVTRSRLTFWYYMYGNRVDCLEVRFSCGKFLENIAWKLCGEQHSSWKLAQVMIPLLCTHYSVGIRAYTRGSPQGDIAIDDIKFDDGTSAGVVYCLCLFVCLYVCVLAHLSVSVVCLSVSACLSVKTRHSEKGESNRWICSKRKRRKEEKEILRGTTTRRI